MTEDLDALREVYRAYLESYEQRVIDNGPFHGLQKFLLGNSPAADRKADAAFYSQVEQAVARLTAVLRETDGPVAAQAVRCIALDTEGTDPSSRLMIEATQALAIPLLPWLADADRVAILEAYKARYPKKRMLSPRQQELLAALEGG